VSPASLIFAFVATVAAAMLQGTVGLGFATVPVPLLTRIVRSIVG